MILRILILLLLIGLRLGHATTNITAQTVNVGNLVIYPPPPSYLVKQGFEGAGYDNGETWIPTGAGLINPDYTGIVLDGSQSLVITNLAGGCSISKSFTSSSEVYAYVLIRPIVRDITFNFWQLWKLKSGSGLVALIQVHIDGTLVVSANAATTATTVASITAGTTYHMWLHYKKGTGVTAVADLAFSTNGVRPTSGDNFAQITVGTSVDNADNIVLGSESTDVGIYIFDKIRVSTSQIGDNPP